MTNLPGRPSSARFHGWDWLSLVGGMDDLDEPIKKWNASDPIGHAGGDQAEVHSLYEFTSPP